MPAGRDAVDPLVPLRAAAVGAARRVSRLAGLSAHARVPEPGGVGGVRARAPGADVRGAIRAVRAAPGARGAPTTDAPGQWRLSATATSATATTIPVPMSIRL